MSVLAGVNVPITVFHPVSHPRRGGGSELDRSTTVRPQQRHPPHTQKKTVLLSSLKIKYARLGALPGGRNRRRLEMSGLRCGRGAMPAQPLWRYHWCRCLSAVAAYLATALVGAAIFHGLEGGIELERAREYQSAKEEQISYIQGYLQSAADPDLAGNFTALIRGLERYAASNQNAPDPEALNWTFGGSFYFAITIMTTIGTCHSPPCAHDGTCLASGAWPLLRTALTLPFRPAAVGQPRAAGQKQQSRSPPPLCPSDRGRVRDLHAVFRQRPCHGGCVRHARLGHLCHVHHRADEWFRRFLVLAGQAVDAAQVSREGGPGAITAGKRMERPAWARVATERVEGRRGGRRTRISEGGHGGRAHHFA